MNFDTQEEWQHYLLDQFHGVKNSLEMVQNEYDTHYGKVPFSAYTDVIEFFLRKETDIDLSLVRIKSKGRAVIVEVHSPENKNFDPVCIKVGRQQISYYAITFSELTQEQQESRRLSNWYKYCKNHGLDKDDLYKEFIVDSQKFKIIGCKTRKQTYGIECYSYERSRNVFVKTSLVLTALKKGITNENS